MKSSDVISELWFSRKWRKYKLKTIRIKTIKEENLTIIARVD
jgi:hypothetical protein